ncbi:uncharacterized protein CEXT_556041 [Caerostris extrusa]|uniref:Uncharacterized protein n=1 Tax=Caerostris extrusa TaxID=172846 RepID=A0AAV4UVK7_CAEEX|nr:uncharacterized protein CEXT_556041 [Caerostris extrusa]
MLWKRIFKRSFAWQMVKNVIFFACCSFFIIQSIEFYNHYSTYPTTTSIAVESPESLKIPAITVCDKNIVRRTHFCAAYPDSCQIPYDIEIFCQRHPVICAGNDSKYNDGEKANKIQYISLHSDKYEAFYPWMVSPVFFSIHSSVIPENPLTTGKAVRPGYQYKVSYRLEEEHLLPHPYATNCTDYDALWRENGKTGPRSQEMCIYMCLKKYNKRCTSCEEGTNDASRTTWCVGILGVQTTAEQDQLPRPRQQRPSQLHRRLPMDSIQGFESIGYIITSRKLNVNYDSLDYDIPFEGERIDIAVHLIDKDVTVISHIPRYGEWELFSYIGGLIGCWLGISAWAFVDIIEANFRRFLRLIQKLRQKSKKQTASCV